MSTVELLVLEETVVMVSEEVEMFLLSVAELLQATKVSPIKIVNMFFTVVIFNIGYNGSAAWRRSGKSKRKASILHERSQCCEPLAKLRKKSQCSQHWRYKKYKRST